METVIDYSGAVTKETARQFRDLGSVSRKSRNFSGVCNSGDLILFVSSKRWHLEARNFAVIFIFIPFTTYEKTSFTE